ncbi:MAG: hypothetical protein WD556_11495 [Actinomycetota bacterium]
MIEHGTRTCYVQRRCRRLECKDANRLYQASRMRAELYGRPTTNLVSADEARRHLGNLSGISVGQHAVARVSGLSRSAIREIAIGRTKRIHPDTERRILAIGASARLGQALVDATETWQLVDELLASGVRRWQIAKAIGNKAKPYPSLQLSRERVLQRTAVALKRLHDELWRDIPAFREHCRCLVPIERELQRDAS